MAENSRKRKEHTRTNVPVLREGYVEKHFAVKAGLAERQLGGGPLVAVFAVADSPQDQGPRLRVPVHRVREEGRSSVSRPPLLTDAIVEK
nr:uncharacterized protein CTRU02_14608 [Colletotrichum truncatum]KAF6782052.1 hypothetical protein CTRU02_14608 [Colletotrichum truncatum]